MLHGLALHFEVICRDESQVLQGLKYLSVRCDMSDVIATDFVVRVWKE